MSAVSRLPQSDPLYVQPSPRRLVYATGMLLDAQDFSDEQTYHRGRLAEALVLLSGGGTLAGLRCGHAPENAATGSPEEILVAPGVAIDRLGRLVEVIRPACLRLQRWYDGSLAGDGGDTLRRAAYDNPGRFLGARLRAQAGTGDVPAIPTRAVVADVYVRFVACREGLTPSFASGPYDALNAVNTSRLRDAYELLLVARSDGLDDDFSGLPEPGPDLADIADADLRRAALQDAVLDAWTSNGRSGQEGQIAPPAGHPPELDPTAQFLARVLVPVTADDPPQRDGSAVLVDNWTRRFVPSVNLLSRWTGI
ncbi:hypothetical protein [Methylococcus sp. EFPC2]|uniref:hypothetical protein n=1 Tax=Methylococcus sp. EFPC2 TaxID=2812648 RepID=UPI001967BB90|nr:hypothetical protein [Methylococcus sp. EFPC2]QSA98404.1 hypothetical protein JWZ97_06240 [Methylococcus sp. EFPC2]